MSWPSAIGVSVSWSPQMSSTGRCRFGSSRAEILVDDADERAAHDPGDRAIVGGAAMIRAAAARPRRIAAGRARTARPCGAPCTSGRARRRATSGAAGCRRSPPAPSARCVPGMSLPSRCRSARRWSGRSGHTSRCRADPAARCTRRRSRAPTTVCRGSAVAPKPGRSGTISRRPACSASRIGANSSDDTPQPWSSSSGRRHRAPRTQRAGISPVAPATDAPSPLGSPFSPADR